MLITAPGGELLGIRVEWTIKPQYLSCQFTTLRVELNSGQVGRDISVTNRTADFNNEQLDCNTQYTPTVRAVINNYHYISKTDSGDPLFYRGKEQTMLALISDTYYVHYSVIGTFIVAFGKMSGSPSQLQRVCVGPSTLPQHGGRVNISWDPLPCHLQNGANISGYIIQYTMLTTGVRTSISSSDRRLECHRESGGPYSCVIAVSLPIADVAYSFQVAAQNIHGVGSFSNPVTTVYGSQSKHI